MGNRDKRLRNTYGSSIGSSTWNKRKINYGKQKFAGFIHSKNYLTNVATIREIVVTKGRILSSVILVHNLSQEDM